jgi:hypothetical protein
MVQSPADDAANPDRGHEARTRAGHRPGAGGSREKRPSDSPCCRRTFRRDRRKAFPNEGRRCSDHPSAGQAQVHEQWRGARGDFQRLFAARISGRREMICSPSRRFERLHEILLAIRPHAVPRASPFAISWSDASSLEGRLKHPHLADSRRAAVKAFIAQLVDSFQMCPFFQAARA